MSGIKLKTAGGGSVTLQPETTGVDVVLNVPADNSMLMSAAELAAGTGASLVGYTPAGTGAVATTVQDALREMAVSVKRFGAKGDGVTDDTAAVQACWDYCRANNRTAFVPKDVYRIGQTNIGPGMSIIGEAGSTFKLLDNQPKFTRMLTTENNPWVVTSQTEDSPPFFPSPV